jgi:hypothetical protein
MVLSLGATSGNGVPYGRPWGYPYGDRGYTPYNPPAAEFGVPWMSPFGPPIPVEQEIGFLRGQAHILKAHMDQIDARIKELEKEIK